MTYFEDNVRVSRLTAVSTIWRHMNWLAHKGWRRTLLNWDLARLAFVICAFALRAPLLLPLQLHPDEHTFLNVGHDVSLGHLPYLHMWDNKPPLLFILLAPVTALAHHQIWVVRLLATALDIMTALLAKAIADRLFQDFWGNWIVAIWCFTAMTIWVAGGSLMSETIALPFLLGGALFLLEERPPLWQAFAAGLLLGSATLIRTLPVFPAIAVVGLIFGQAWI